MTKIPRVIVLIDRTRSYDRGLLRGIAKYSRFHGHWACCRKPLSYLKPAGKKNILTAMKDWGANGIIARDSEITEGIIEMDLPMVISLTDEEPNPDYCNIITNNIKIGRMAAEHMLGNRFKHLAYCGFDHAIWSEERHEGFRQRIAQEGLRTHFYESPKAKANRLWEREQNLLAQWLLSLPKPVGLMACNDDRGQQVTEICNIIGLRIPEEVAIIGVDNDELVCDLTDPSLSSIALNTEKAGYESAEALDKMMAGQDMAGHLITVEPTHVVTRHSSNILAISDPEVSAAVRFIHQNANQPVQVSDVVEATGLSRRGLQQRFRRVLGRSMYHEIRRVRVERVVGMLLESNLPTYRIAQILGYPNAGSLSRTFRQEKGMCPVDYRKKYGSK